MTNITKIKNLDPSYIARKIFVELNINPNIATDLECVLNELDIRIRYKELKAGILGACKSEGLFKLIVINPKIENEGRKRFTIAHEVGHLCLHHGLAYCTEEDMSINITQKDKEAQANMFASELLLPYQSMKKVISKRDISIGMIDDISSKYKTSFVSTAIRLVSLCQDPVAIFYHRNNKIQWAIKSCECNYQLERTNVSAASVAGRFNLNNKIQEGYVDLSSWFIDHENNTDDEIRCFEETIYFKNLDSYLTIAKIEDMSY